MAVQNEKNKLRAIMDTVNIIIVSLDAEGKILSINRKGCELLKRSEVELIGVDWFNNCLPQPDGVEKVKPAFNQIMNGNIKAFEYFENEIQDADGKRRQIAWHNAYFRDDEGRIIGTLSTGEDITERKLAEDKFKKAFYSNPSISIIARISDDYIADVNHAFEEILGFTREEAIGHTALELSLWAFPEERARMLPELLANGRVEKKEVHFRAKNGAMKTCQYSSVIIDIDSEKYALASIMDISERKEIETTLIESENRQRDLFNTIGSGVAVYEALNGGEDFMVLDINPAGEKLSRFNRDEIKGKSILELFPGVKEMGLFAVLQEVWRTGKPRHLAETRYKDERIEQWVENRVYKLPSGEIVAVYDDNTGRKQTEDALRESEERYRLLHENAGIGIGYYAPDGTVLSYNRLAASNMKGVPEDFIGKSIYELFPKPEAEFYHARIKEACLTDKPMFYEDRVVLPSGNKFFLSTFSKITDAENNILGIQIISQDITDRKRAEDELREKEQQLRAIGDSFPYGLIYQLQIEPDRTARFTHCSAQVEKLHECTADQALADPNLLFCRIVEEDREAYTRAVEKSIAEFSVFDHSVRIRRKSGEIRWHRMISKPRIGNDGAIVFNGLDMDITELKLAEDAIKKQLSEKETLLQEVHHRVKNNIANIEGLLSMQADSTSIPEVKSAIYDTIARVQSIRVLYERLLLSRTYQDVSIKAYAEGLIDSLAKVFVSDKKIVIEKQISDFIISSKKAISIGIIINELMTNVFKYAFKDRDDGTISISIEKSENRATLNIKDNGIGIDERIESNKSPGFGLIIVRMLVEQLGGAYTIKNENGTKSSMQFDI